MATTTLVTSCKEGKVCRRVSHMQPEGLPYVEGQGCAIVGVGVGVVVVLPGVVVAYCTHAYTLDHIPTCDDDDDD